MTDNDTIMCPICGCTTLRQDTVTGENETYRCWTCLSCGQAFTLWEEE
jgi:transcription elongation factor Elf1